MDLLHESLRACSCRRRSICVASGPMWCAVHCTIRVRALHDPRACIARSACVQCIARVFKGYIGCLRGHFRVLRGPLGPRRALHDAFGALHDLLGALHDLFGR